MDVLKFQHRVVEEEHNRGTKRKGGKTEKEGKEEKNERRVSPTGKRENRAGY
jgi:hypothetical protein